MYRSPAGAVVLEQQRLGGNHTLRIDVLAAPGSLYLPSGSLPASTEVAVPARLRRVGCRLPALHAKDIVLHDK